ncbi:hypothetical protein PS1_022312 [Malus domestica]
MFATINRGRSASFKAPPIQRTNCPAQTLSTTLRFLFSFSANTSSVLINSTVEAIDDTFSLDKQHCVEADWLSIQVSVEKDFQVFIGRGHLISLFGEVRCYSLLGLDTLNAELFHDWILTSKL